MLFSALLTSAWSGSVNVSVSQVFYNAMALYYLLVINLGEHRARKSDSFWPLDTVRSMCGLCAHAVMGALYWPKELLFSPRHREERVAESLFSKAEASYRGTPSIKDGIWGLHTCHLQQFRSGQAVPKGQYIDPLSPERAEELAKQALKDAAHLQAYLCVDQEPKTILGSVSTFWKHEGRALLVGDAALHENVLEEAELDLFASEVDVTESDAPPSHARAAKVRGNLITCRATAGGRRPCRGCPNVRNSACAASVSARDGRRKC